MWNNEYWAVPYPTGTGTVDETQVNTIITTTVDKPFVDTLDVDALTLNSVPATDYALKTDVPTIIGTTVTKTFVDGLDVDAVTLNNVAATLYALKTDIVADVTISSDFRNTTNQVLTLSSLSPDVFYFLNVNSTINLPTDVTTLTLNKWYTFILISDFNEQFTVIVNQPDITTVNYQPVGPSADIVVGTSVNLDTRRGFRLSFLYTRNVSSTNFVRLQLTTQLTPLNSKDETEAYVNAMNVNAATLNNVAAANYALKTDIVTTTVTKALVDGLGVNAATLNNVAAASYALKTDIPPVVTSTVTKAYVDALNVNAVTLNNVAAANYALKTDVPTIITTNVTKAFVDGLDVDAVTLNNVAANLYALKSEISSKYRPMFATTQTASFTITEAMFNTMVRINMTASGTITLPTVDGTTWVNDSVELDILNLNLGGTATATVAVGSGNTIHARFVYYKISNAGLVTLKKITTTTPYSWILVGQTEA